MQINKVQIKKEGIDKKIPDTNKLVTYIAFNIKIGDVENKMSGISRLGTDTDFDTKIGKVEKNS